MVPRKRYLADLKASIAQVTASSDEVTLSAVESKLRDNFAESALRDNFKRPLPGRITIAKILVASGWLKVRSADVGCAGFVYRRTAQCPAPAASKGTP